MKNSWQKLLTAVCLILILTITVFVQNQTSSKFSNEAKIKADIEIAPCDNDERLEVVKKLFKEIGAEERNLIVENFENVKNLIITKKGKTDETIIVGAHYDKTSTGCGVIDNWSGIVILAHLYKTIKNLETEKTYKFVAFGKEEKGLIGSNAMAQTISKEEIEIHCAMVNLDSFGLTYPQVLENISDKSLTELAEETAETLDVPFSAVSLGLATSDSASFQKVKIPAITIHGLSNDYENYLHKSKDIVKSVNPTSVYIGYRFVLLYLVKVDKKGCADFR